VTTGRHRRKLRSGPPRATGDELAEVVRRYRARNRVEAEALFARDESDLEVLGYEPVDVAWIESWAGLGCLTAILTSGVSTNAGQSYLEVAYQGPANRSALPPVPHGPFDYAPLAAEVTTLLCGVLGWLSISGQDLQGGWMLLLLPGALLIGIGATLWLSRRSPRWGWIAFLVVAGPLLFFGSRQLHMFWLIG